MLLLPTLLSLLPTGCAQDTSPPAEAAAVAPPPDPCPATVEALAARYPTQVDLTDARLRERGLIVVQKGARRLQRFDGGQQVDGACWRVGLGFTPEGHKLIEGDGRTPEGWYRTSDKPWSQWYAAIAVHYPGAEDAQAAEADGRIDAATRRSIDSALRRGEKPPQTTPLGGEILIHGGSGWSDWTWGCVAMEDAEIDALRATLPARMETNILILP